MRDIDLQRAIKNRNTEAIVNLFIDKENKRLKANYYCETELWDYKTDCPCYKMAEPIEWANIAKDIIAFHNLNGGLLIFGVNDDNYLINGIRSDIDSKLFNDKVRKWIGDKIWIEYSKQYIFDDDRYIGFALIPPKGQTYAKFICNSPLKNGKLIFLENGSALRKGDSSIVLSPSEIEELNKTLYIPIVGKFFEVDEENFRILAPEYSNFVYRKDICEKVIKGLSDIRSSVVSLIGIGGIGKTAIATWAVLKAYEQKKFSFIVSITAKDRELTKQGIASINPTLTSYENLIDTIFDVLHFGDYKQKEISEKELMINSLLKNSNGLLYIDNLETVDDQRIINFLNNLPIGCKAITTSRRTRVNVSNIPILVDIMNKDEAREYICSLLNNHICIKQVDDNESDVICNNSDGIPLAMKWLITTSKNKNELLSKSYDLHESGYRGNELLEFSFRRIFESVGEIEKKIIKILSLFESPIGIEPIYISLNNTSPEIFDSLEDLFNDSIIYRYFDASSNDYSYSLLPLIRNFIRNNELTSIDEVNIRKKLSNWYEAKDIKNPNERIIFQKIRQGTDNPESSLIDLALSAKKNGKIDEAEDFFRQAIKRNPKSYKALREYAELLRHCFNKPGDAIKYYEQAISCMPIRGYENGIILREYGILVKDSGTPDATNKAIEAMESALQEIPNDQLLIFNLASLYMRKVQYQKALPLLLSIKDSSNPRTREYTLDMLFKIYEYNRDYQNIADIKRELTKA